MKIFLKTVLIAGSMVFLLHPALAQQTAEDGAPADEAMPKAQSRVVTSVQKCFDQLDPADAADIRRNFLTPYQECQRRLALKKQAAAQKSAKGDEDLEKAEKPVTPRNYVKVQDAKASKTDTDTSGKSGAEKPKKKP